MSLKENAISEIKGNKLLYTLYYYFFSFTLKIIKLFVRPDDKLILFVSYGGRYFNESPKCMYDTMKTDDRFSDYRLVWAFRNPSLFPEVEDRIKIDSLKYFVLQDLLRTE